jgi:hypothetical protein
VRQANARAHALCILTTNITQNRRQEAAKTLHARNKASYACMPAAYLYSIILSSCRSLLVYTAPSRTGRARRVCWGLRLGFARARLRLRLRLRLWLRLRLRLRHGLWFSGFWCWVGLRCGLRVPWFWLWFGLVGLRRWFRLIRLRRWFRLVGLWLWLWSDHWPRLRLIVAGGGCRGHDDKRQPYHQCAPHAHPSHSRTNDDRSIESSL